MTKKSLVNVLFPAYFSLASLFAASPSKAQSPINIPVASEISGSPGTTAIETSKSEEIVMMELWGIQISSSDPARLSTVMDQVNREIDDTRRAMQYAYEALLEASRGIDITWINDYTEQNAGRIAVLTGKSGMPRISLADALFRINMANDASSIYDGKSCYKSNDPLVKNQCAIPPQFVKQIETYNNAASDLCNFFAIDEKNIYSKFNRFEGREQNEYKQRRFVYGDAIPQYRRPFQRFQEIALHQHFPSTSTPKCRDGNIKLLDSDAKLQNLKFEWARRQKTLRKFVLAQQPSTGSTANTYQGKEDKKLRQQFDAMLSPIVVAVNRDIEDFFIRPTLYRIKQIVGRDYNVEYAEVGRTTLAGLNGLTSTVVSEMISSIDEPTPLRLNELINNAKTSKESLNDLFPSASASNQSISKINPGLLGQPFTSLSPADATSVVALLAALSKEEVRWRGIPSGTNIAITPTVFDDQTGAKLSITYTIGSSATKDVSEDVGKKLLLSNENPLRDPSRVIKNTVATQVKVNTWDLFALSSLNNQTTITGRRWSVPLIGPIWEGIFGDIPVVGNLLSPKAPPLTVHHQNIILVNTLVVPSANGLASNLFP
jgi:surface antigen